MSDFLGAILALAFSFLCRAAAAIMCGSTAFWLIFGHPTPAAKVYLDCARWQTLSTFKSLICVCRSGPFQRHLIVFDKLKILLWPAVVLVCTHGLILQFIILILGHKNVCLFASPRCRRALSILCALIIHFLDSF